MGTYFRKKQPIRTQKTKLVFEKPSDLIPGWMDTDHVTLGWIHFSNSKSLNTPRGICSFLLFFALFCSFLLNFAHFVSFCLILSHNTYLCIESLALFCSFFFGPFFTLFCSFLLIFVFFVFVCFLLFFLLFLFCSVVFCCFCFALLCLFLLFLSSIVIHVSYTVMSNVRCLVHSHLFPSSR